MELNTAHMLGSWFSVDFYWAIKVYLRMVFSYYWHGLVLEYHYNIFWVFLWKLRKNSQYWLSSITSQYKFISRLF